jgi:hypothetical protein
MKKKLFWIFTVIFIITLVFAIMGIKKFNDHPITITEQFMQEKINAMLPIEKQKLLMVVNVEKVDIRLGDGRIYANYEVSAKSNKGKDLVSLTALTSGDLVYRSGAFYLDHSDFEMKDLEFGNKDFLSSTTGAINDLIPKRFKDKLTINEDNIEAKLLEGIESLAEKSLDRFPVYKFKDNFSGLVIRAAIKGIIIQPGVLLVEVSFWNLTKTVLMLVAAFIISLIIVASIFFTTPNKSDIFFFLSN